MTFKESIITFSTLIRLPLSKLTIPSFVIDVSLIKKFEIKYGLRFLLPSSKFFEIQNRSFF